VTNNYHVLRSSILARRAGLKIDGVGAKTSWYYLPNAIFREYVAYLSLFKTWNFVVSLLIFGWMIYAVTTTPTVMVREGDSLEATEGTQIRDEN
jgi:hypothetical protein